MSRSSTRVSIVMAAHQAERTIEAAMDSVRQQSHGDWELLVVDDASTDRTAAILRNWAQADSRIRVLHRSSNGGPALARNDGLDQATGEFIAFLDADDEWHPDKLRLQLSVMQNPGCDISYCSYRRCTDQAPQLSMVVFAPAVVDRALILRYNPILLSSAMIRRQRLGHLRFKPVRHEDYVYWHDALETVGMAHRVPGDVPLVRYRVASGSLSGRKSRSAIWHWANLRRDFGLPWGQAAWLFAHYACHGLSRLLHDRWCRLVSSETGSLRQRWY